VEGTAGLPGFTWKVSVKWCVFVRACVCVYMLACVYIFTVCSCHAECFYLSQEPDCVDISESLY